MNNWVVSKFGGSSVSDAAAMFRCAEIVKKQFELKVVILSATYNTTNLLEEVGAFAAIGKKLKAQEILEAIKDQHFKIAEDIDANDDTVIYLEEFVNEGNALIEGISLLKECSPRAMDRLYSIGERLSSALFCGLLNTILRGEKEVIFFDARQIIKTNSDFGKALPDLEMIKNSCENLLIPIIENKDVIVVTQGFIGSDEYDVTTTLGREGSDFSAALIAEAIGASLLQIWTDVPGIATTDPQLIDSACIIPDLTYDEASTMAHLGAQVLFPKTLSPIMRENIPLFVGSSLDPNKDGTWVQREASYLPFIRSLAVMNDLALVTIESSNILPSKQFFSNVYDNLKEHGINFQFINFSGKNVSFLMDDDETQIDSIRLSLGRIASTRFEQSMSLVSLIGNEMDRANDLISDIFKSLSRSSIRTVQIGGSSHSLSFVVSQNEKNNVVFELHAHLISHAIENNYQLRTIFH